MSALALVRQQESRMPSDRQMDARRANALRVAEKIAALLSSGHRVYDEDGDVLEKVDMRATGDVVFSFREGGNVIYFLNDKTLDNGAMHSIAEFNAQFTRWTFVHPENIRPLVV